jgi:biopolymer transport protein ExbD
MAGVDVQSGGNGGRRNGNFEINMIPMIDLLMVTISFLLITAVWANMSRLQADAQVPGPPQPCADGSCEEKVERKLHVLTTDGQKFKLEWREGKNVVSTTEVDVTSPASAGTAGVAKFPALAEAMKKEWQTSGTHRAPDDATFDRAVIHASNDVPYSTLVGVMDAAAAPRRNTKTGHQAPAFDVALAID